MTSKVKTMVKASTLKLVNYFGIYCELNNISRDQMADYLIAERKTWRMLHPGRLSRSYASLAMKGQEAWFPKNIFTV
jgi:hypothetical protein